MGSQPASKLADIQGVLRRAGDSVPPFRLSLGRLGTFGPTRAPRVLWVEALQPDGRLQQARRRLEDELRAAGVGFDDKPLRPHLTLGRSRGSASGGVRLVEASLSIVPHLVRQIVLFESQLSSKGPEYYQRAIVDLVGSTASDAGPESGAEPRP
jgi:2'-5' RNA ligase